MTMGTNIMFDDNRNDIPCWFAYNADGDLDMEATLSAVPQKLDTANFVFSQVPKWFDVCPSEAIDELIEELEDSAATERNGITPEQIRQTRENLKKMSEYHALYRRDGLSANQKELVRCLSYWLSLKTMGEIPLTGEEAEELF